MAIKIIKNNNEYLYGVNTYSIDSIEDLAQMPECAVGSSALLISKNEKYLKSNSGEWFLAPESGGDTPVVTKESIGLGNVDNTSDMDKPISTAVQEALNGTITGITAAGTPLTPVDGVVEIPYAGNPVPGCVRISSTTNDGYYGIMIYTSSQNIGMLALSEPSAQRIQTRRAKSQLGFGAINTANYDFAVKVAMTDGIGDAWTDAEKTGAWSRLNSIKSTMDSVAVAGALYYLGEQSTITISMPTDALVGQEIVVFFKSGSTATTLVCDLTGFSLVPVANKSYRLTFELVHKADPDDDTEEDEWICKVEEG